jgi:hypothetical protein
MQTVSTIAPLQLPADNHLTVSIHAVDLKNRLGDVEITALCPGVLWEAAALPGWHRGLCLVTLLVARAAGIRSYRASDAVGVRKALRQATEERYG